MNIDELEAGRELDALVAKEVMGWHQEYARRITGDMAPMWKEPEFLVPPGGYEAEKVPAFSTDIAVARAAITKVLDYLAQPGPRGGFRSGNVTLAKGAWIRHISETDIHHGRWLCKFIQECSGKQKRWWGFAGDLPLAICRAALKVVNAG